MARAEAYYTVYVNDELWVNSIDSINQIEAQGIGGVIFCDLTKANTYVKYLRKHDKYKDAQIEIKVVTIHV